MLGGSVSPQIRHARRRSAIPLAAVTTLAFLISAMPAQTNGQRRNRCASSGSLTITSNAKVRVFSRRLGDGPRVYYACLRRSGRTTRLGPRYTSDYVYFPKRFRVAGTLVAYTRARVVVGRGSQAERRILVRDLASNRLVRQLIAGEHRGAAYNDPDANDGVRDLVVDAAGDVAWIVQNPNALPNPPPGNYTSTRATELYVGKRDSTPVLVDQGAGIVQTSLSRDACTISWIHDSAGRSMRFCP